LDQVKELLECYLRNEIERKHLQETLGIKERRFMVGSKTNSSAFVFEKISKKSTRPKGFLTTNSIDITTSNFTSPPRKSTIGDSKEP